MSKRTLVSESKEVIRFYLQRASATFLVDLLSAARNNDCQYESVCRCLASRFLAEYSRRLVYSPYSMALDNAYCELGGVHRKEWVTRVMEWNNDSSYEREEEQKRQRILVAMVRAELRRRTKNAVSGGEGNSFQ